LTAETAANWKDKCFKRSGLHNLEPFIRHLGPNREQLGLEPVNGLCDIDEVNHHKGVAMHLSQALAQPKPAHTSAAKFRYIDLFAGIGGIRIPFDELGGKCVFSSEWDRFAQDTYEANFGHRPDGDITKIPSKSIPKHDLLLGGFPCQAFSLAGLKKGFLDTRGTMFFEIQRILAEHRPAMFLLENVKQLRGHDGGRTLETIKRILGNYNAMRYKDFHKDFAARHVAPRLTGKSKTNMTLIIDVSSVELFADDGLTVMTSIFLPNKPYNKMLIQSADGAVIKKLEYIRLNSIWK